MESRVWVLTGNEENWEVAIRDKIWGVKEGRLKGYWDQLGKKDLLFFYSTAPVGGLIGIGRVESKFRQDKPLWPDEVRGGRVIYPYRFGFEILYYLRDRWRELSINVGDLRLPHQAGINPLNRPEATTEVLNRIREKWNVEPPDVVIEKVEHAEPKTEVSLHNQIRDKLFAIGQLKSFISEREYPIDGERLDVAWRKVVKGVPTKVFEVQVSGNIHQALSKLKHAWDLWNSEPFLIVDPRHKQKVDELLSGTFHEIAPIMKIITLDKVDELYNRLIAEKELFEELGL